jgi:hypothetical protein
MPEPRLTVVLDDEKKEVRVTNPTGQVMHLQHPLFHGVTLQPGETAVRLIDVGAMTDDERVDQALAELAKRDDPI